MGLDMYLKAERYVSGWEHSNAAEKDLYELFIERSGVGVTCEASPSLDVSVTVGYWRKANAIHGWFVTNVQDGEDECSPHYVSRAQLKDLRALCNDLYTRREEPGIEEVVLAKMPPVSGFFFGSTDIDEWFWADIENTIVQIDRALSIPEQFTFEYRSSW